MPDRSELTNKNLVKIFRKDPQALKDANPQVGIHPSARLSNLKMLV